jgi:hypothetical protein
MVDKPSSPFARLDTGLLRSTKTLPQPDVSPNSPASEPQAEESDSKPVSTRVRTRASKQSIKRASQIDSLLASKPADSAETMVRSIRRVVRTPGREVSFVRLTPDEKAQLADLVYAFKRRGQKTSETEITRIAVNFILEDYRANTETSILERVLEALRE